MSVAIREGNARDIAAVLKIDNAHSPVFGQSDSYEKTLTPPGLLLVATDQDTVCGFAACSSVLDEATLLNLAVLPEARGKGVARLLLRHVFDRLCARDVRRLMLEVREGNDVARALYATLGFEQDGLREQYYASTDGGASEAAILMSRRLG